MTTKAMKTVNRISGGHMTLGKALRAIRLADGIMQKDFAAMLDVKPAYLSDLENERKEVSAKKAAEIAKILGQSEKQFVRLAIQDSLARQGLPYDVNLNHAA